MAYIKNKTLYVLDNNRSYTPFHTVDEEVFLTNDLIANVFLYEEFRKAVRFPLSKRVTRVYLLNDDETIFKDISEYITAGSIGFSYKQGCTREGSITLNNSERIFFPNKINGLIWQGRKMRIDIGVYYNGRIYWKNCGIFVSKIPSVNESDYTIQINIFDKFALLDGTISGKRDHEFCISRGTSIRVAIEACIGEEMQHGKPYDFSSVVFPVAYNDFVTPYTINKDPNCSMGEIIIELADMISCDVYYDDFGHLTLTSGTDEISLENRGIWWNFKEDEISSASLSLSYNLDSVANKITVVGAIDKGAQFIGVYENTNPKSQSNINISELRPLWIEDSNLWSNDMCLERAKYEFIKNARLLTEIKCSSIFIPCLLPNQIVRLNNNRLNILNKKFVINSIDIDLFSSEQMEISISSLEEIIING